LQENKSSAEFTYKLVCTRIVGDMAFFSSLRGMVEAVEAYWKKGNIAGNSIHEAANLQ
jgi:hypothetical protein